MTPGLTPDVEFDAIFARLVLQLERGVAVVTVIAAVLVLAVLGTAHLVGATVGAAVTWTALAFACFYLCELGLLQLGLYARSMRYVSTVVDVTLPTAIIAFGVMERGVVFALTGGGPMLYLLAVCVSTLRLSPALCVMSGVVGTLQFILVSVLLVIPSTTAAESALMASPGYVLASKSILILAGAVFGALATSSMRRLLRRITWSAVERDRARGLFGQSASESIVSQLLATGEGNTRQSMTILSVEIRGFSRIAQKQAPAEVVRTLNTFFEKMNEVAAAHGGVVSKVFGSSMLAVFVPVPSTAGSEAADAAAALAAASRMSAVAAEMGLKIGAGLHRGEAVIGSIGGAERQELSFVGETVTIAVGMQELTRRIGPGVLFTQSVSDGAPAGARESVGWFEVRGSDSLVEVFRPSKAAAA